MAMQIQVFDQLKQAAQKLSKKQRYMLLGGAVLTVATLLVFVQLIGKRDYKPLFTDLEQQDVQKLSTELAAKNIPTQVSTDGKVLSVPADQVDAARIEVAAAGMPHSGRLGFELFDKVSWGQTEFDEKVNYQRAMEGELERTIQQLHDVHTARVHLVLQSDSVFVSRERPAKASVIVKTKDGELSEESQNAIMRLVAGAVDNLKPENVTVTDADTNRPLKTKHNLVGDEEQEQLMLTRLMATLGPVLGRDHVRASVDVEFDPSTMEETQDSYDPDSQVAVARQASEEVTGPSAMQNGQQPVGGVPGTASNVPGASNAQAQPAAAAANDAHSAKNESQTYAVNHLNRHTLQPSGRIRRITAAVAVDDRFEQPYPGGPISRRKWSPEELAKLEQLAQGALGIDPSRGDHLAIENVSFDIPLQAAPPRITPVQKLRTTITDWQVAVRYGSLLFLFLVAYFLMLRPVKKELVTTFRKLTGQYEEEQTPAAAAAALASGGASSGEVDLLGEPTKPRGLFDGFDSTGFFGEDRQLVKKQLIERVRKDPTQTSRLIQSWVNEDAG